MLYKDIFNQLVLLIGSPNRAWEKLAGDMADSVKKDYFLLRTLILLNVAAAFVSAVFEVYSGASFIRILLKPVFVAVVCLSSYWLVYFVFTEFLCKKFYIEPSKSVSIRLVVYSISLLLIVNAIITLFPGLFFLIIMDLYILYIVWEGIGRCFTSLGENKQANLALIFTGSMLAIFFLVKYLVFKGLPD